MAYEFPLSSQHILRKNLRKCDGFLDTTICFAFTFGQIFASLARIPFYLK